MPRGPKPSPGPSNPRSKRTHDWNHAKPGGWPHGKRPTTPKGLMPETAKAWRAWFDGWWASFYVPEDVPQLTIMAHLYDAVIRGDVGSMTKLQPMLDRYGITPKGRQDLRWAPPKGDDAAAAAEAAGVADDLAKRRAEREQRIS